MKIIMIRSTNLYTNRIRREAKSLSKNGFDVTILEWDRDAKAKSIEKEKEYTVIRFKFKAPYGPKVVFFLPFFWIYEFIWLLSNNWDAVHSTDFDTYIIALFIAKFKRKYLVYDIFDYYADMIGNVILRNIVSKLDRYLMHYANYVIIADYARINQIGITSNSHIIEITNSPEDIIYNYLISKQKVISFNRFTIFFAGTLQKDRHLNIDKVISAILDIEDIDLLIAGTGDEVDEIIKLSKTYSNIKYLGYKIGRAHV